MARMNEREGREGREGEKRRKRYSIKSEWLKKKR
jgi:hypothetical protein